MPIRVAIVEDDAEIRKLTCSLLNFYVDIECTGAFSNAETFCANLPSLLPDVVLMDIGLPGQNGIACVRECKPAFPNVEFVMFTDHLDSNEIFEALAAGATGYVLKGGTPERLAQDIRDVQAGGSPMSRQISRMVTASFQRTETRHPHLERLTKQEWEVLRGLAQGWSYKEIATRNFVSEHTIRSQVRSIYQKLEVHTRTEALNILNKKKE